MRISVIRTMTRIGHRGGRDYVISCGQEERLRSYCSSSLKIEKVKVAPTLMSAFIFCGKNLKINFRGNL